MRPNHARGLIIHQVFTHVLEVEMRMNSGFYDEIIKISKPKKKKKYIWI